MDVAVTEVHLIPKGTWGIYIGLEVMQIEKTYT